MTPSSHSFRRLRYFWLLISLVVLLILSPFVESLELRQAPLSILFTFVLLSAVNATSERRSHLFIAASFAFPWLLLRWSGVFLESTQLFIVAELFLICLLSFTLSVVLGRIVSVKETDSNIICGAVSIYLLLGITWAVSYQVIEGLAPGSFGLMSADTELTWNQFLYFSLTTLTTLGYGDVTPLTPVAGIWSTLEAVTGVLYIAVLIARLVALYRR